MKLNDRIWLWANKRPPRKEAAYWITAAGWLFVGMILACTIEAAMLWRIAGWQLFSTLAVLTIAFGTAYYLQDRRQGHIEALYQGSLKRWQERHSRLTAEQTKKEVYQ